MYPFVGPQFNPLHMHMSADLPLESRDFSQMLDPDMKRKAVSFGGLTISSALFMHFTCIFLFNPYSVIQSRHYHHPYFGAAAGQRTPKLNDFPDPRARKWQILEPRYGNP